MKTILLAAILAATTAVQAAEHKLPAPLPAFKTPEQLAKWNEEMTAKAVAADALAAKQANSAPSTSAFYTGKPYVEETGSYAFMFRNYNPELNRWTTVDQSGFPDEANSYIYTNRPTSAIDPDGLKVVNTYEAHWKTQFTFDFQTSGGQSWTIDRGYYTAAGPPNGQPTGLIGGASSWQWWPPTSLPASMSWTSSINTITNLTNNSTTGLHLVKVENVVDVMWIPGAIDSQTTYVTKATAEWIVRYNRVYE